MKCIVSKHNFEQTKKWFFVYKELYACSNVCISALMAYAMWCKMSCAYTVVCATRKEATRNCTIG